MVERRPVNDLRKAVREFRRLVVLGEPGSGKTTALQMLRRDLSRAARTDPAAPLPVLVALGGYSGDETALAYIMARVGALGRHLPAYLRAGRCVLLLDGLNEMPQRDYGERVARTQALLDQFPAAPIFVTCRALDYVETLKLQRLEIEPLDINRRREYLHRYLREVDGDALFWRLAGGEDVVALWCTWERAGGGWEDFWQAEKMPSEVYGRTTTVQDALWAGLRAAKLSSLLELSANPYLLAMLIDLYAKGDGQLPQNRAHLFDDFVTVLLAREKDRRRNSGAYWPGDNVLRAALARLAFAMQSAGERGTAVGRTWAAEQLGAVGSPADTIMLAAAGATLLDLSGGQVRFVHQLLQEYFAAVGWQARLTQGDDLRRYWPDGWTTPSGWEETAVLLAGLLPDITPFIEQLLPANPPLAARCLAESGGKPEPATISVVQMALVEIVGNLTAPAMQRVAVGNALNYLGDPRAAVRDPLQMEFCLVPAGPFVMGDGSEQRQYNVPYDYWIGRYPVTVAQFAAFHAAGGYVEANYWTEARKAGFWKRGQFGGRDQPYQWGEPFDLANHPAVGVSWYEALAFVRWFNEARSLPSSYALQLPSEPEWEKAARGGLEVVVEQKLVPLSEIERPSRPAVLQHNKLVKRRYPWGDDPNPQRANCANTNIRSTNAVGCFAPGASLYGVEEMSGNVCEWTRSLYAEYPYPAGGRELAQRETPAAVANIARVLRGGAFDFNVHYVRCAARIGNDPYDPDRNFGFRVVLSPSPLRCGL